jgi:hypothetical protein
MNEHLIRQNFLGADSDKILKHARVGIIGLCGGGSHVAQQLAHIGVGNFSLFDSDRADQSNRNRMVGLTAEDAKNKELKTDVITRLIQVINPDAHVDAISKIWQEEHIRLRDCTAIFGCVDSFTERNQLEQYARRFLVPYIDIGMDVNEEEDVDDSGNHFITGQVILSLAGHPCMWCMGFLRESLLSQEVPAYGAAGEKPQVVWPNGTLASTAVGVFMSLVTPWNRDLLPPLYIEYDGNRFLTSPSKKLETLVGKSCKHFSGPEALGDVSW